MHTACFSALRAFLISALVFGILAYSGIAQSASASGTTAFTCTSKTPEEGRGFSKAHCSSADKVTSGAKFEHTAIPQGTPTELSISNEKTSGETSASTALKIKTTSSEAPITVTATGVSGSWTLENKEEAGEMLAHGTGKLKFTGVTVSPGTCSVPEGTIETKELTAKTVPAGLDTKPASGEIVAEFELTGESCPELLRFKYRLVGHLVATTDGATVTTTDAGTTEQGTLTLNEKGGQKVGIEESLTFSGRAKGSGGSFTSLGWTTGAEEEEQKVKTKEEGKKVFTCREKSPASGAGFSSGHCKPSDAVSSGAKYEHVEAGPGVTEFLVSNEKTAGETGSAAASKLKATISGLTVTLTATGVTGSGTLEDREEGGDVFVHGTGKLKYTGVSVSPATCSVPGGMIETKELTAKTVPTGLRVTGVGEVFAEFEITGATCPAFLKAKWKLIGSVTATIEGATASATHAGVTEQATLRFQTKEGPKAGLEGSLTFSGRAEGSGGAFTALSTT